MKYSKLTLIMLFFLLVMGLSQSYAQENEEPFVVALTAFFSNHEAFIDEMTQLGFIEGENITYLTFSFEGFGNENTTPEEYTNEYNRQLQVMIDTGVDVFVTNTDTDAINLKAMVGDTPIVFARSDDPIATGAVADLITPGGTMTGTVTNRPHERRLQILKDIKPSTDKVLYLYSPNTMEAETVLQQVLAVAETLEIEIIAIQTPDGATAVESLQTVPEGIDWIFMTPYVPLFDPAFIESITTISLAQGAGVSAVIDDISAFYLMGYGPNIAASDRQSARIVARILRGASPAELPVEIAENYLTINLQAAEAIGLEIPVGILRQADRIMRPGDFDTTDSTGS